MYSRTERQMPSLLGQTDEKSSWDLGERHVEARGNGAAQATDLRALCWSRALTCSSEGLRGEPASLTGPWVAYVCGTDPKRLNRH